MKYFLTRHAIFDRDKKVLGYEISFRTSLDSMYGKIPKDDQQTSNVLTDIFLSLGLDKVTDGKKAFVRFSRNMLIGQFAAMFSKDKIAIEIGSDIKVDAQVISACEDLKNSGYMLVLDDYSLQINYEKLLPITQMVKVDVQKVGEFLCKTIVRKLQPKGIQCLLKNVENQQLFNKSFSMDYDFFQGDFFSKPTELDKKDVPVHKINFMQMLKEINQPEIDFDKIENIIKHDVSLTYKLLRMINSSAFGIKNEVKSIKQALVLLGQIEVKKWITLIILSNIGDDKPDELMKKTLLRAKLLEVVASLAGLGQDASDLFLVGMFSLIDAMINQPLESILEGLPLDNDIKNTLLGNESRFQKIYQLVLSYEKGDWTKVGELSKDMKLEEDQLPGFYKQSVEWVNSVAID